MLGGAADGSCAAGIPGCPCCETRSRLVQDREWPEASHRSDEVAGHENPEAFRDAVVVQVRNDGGGSVLVAETQRRVAEWIGPRESAPREVGDDAPRPVRRGVEGLMRALGGHA